MGQKLYRGRNSVQLDCDSEFCFSRCYRATADINDRNVVRFFEQYEEEEAFEAHSQTDYFQTFEEKLPDLLAGEPEVIQFEVDSATEFDL